MKNEELSYIKQYNLEKYFTEKRYLAIMFNDNREEQQLLANFLSDENNLKTFKALVEYFSEHRLLDDFCKKNIFDILNILRHDICPKNIEVINTVNSIYNNVNSQIQDCSINFYRNEYVKRYGKINFKLDDLVNSKKEEIRKSVLLDPLVIVTHLFIDETTFSAYIENFALDSNYLSSIVAIIQDNPFLVENKLFLNRFKNVIIKQSELNKSVINKFRTNKLVKQLSKLEKRI